MYLKVERCNYFLNAVVEVARREPRETPDGRLMSFLLKDPTCDGGQWDMASFGFLFCTRFPVKGISFPLSGKLSTPNEAKLT